MPVQHVSVLSSPSGCACCYGSDICLYSALNSPISPRPHDKTELPSLDTLRDFDNDFTAGGYSYAYHDDVLALMPDSPSIRQIGIDNTNAFAFDVADTDMTAFTADDASAESSDVSLSSSAVETPANVSAVRKRPRRSVSPPPSPALSSASERSGSGGGGGRAFKTRNASSAYAYRQRRKAYVAKLEQTIRGLRERIRRLEADRSAEPDMTAAAAAAAADAADMDFRRETPPTAAATTAGLLRRRRVSPVSGSLMTTMAVVLLILATCLLVLTGEPSATDRGAATHRRHLLSLDDASATSIPSCSYISADVAPSYSDMTATQSPHMSRASL